MIEIHSDSEEVAAYIRFIEVERKRHLAFIDPLFERLPDIGSVIVKQEIEFKDFPKLKTTILLLPLKRYYKSGSEIVSDQYLLKEIQRTK